MAPGVGLLEVDDGQAGVVLERFQVFVTEEVFDVPEVGAAAVELRGAGAPERVGRDDDRQSSIHDQFRELAAKDVGGTATGATRCLLLSPAPGSKARRRRSVSTSRACSCDQRVAPTGFL